MIKYIKRDFRLHTAANEICARRAFFWTFTTKDVVDYSEISRRWREVRHWLGIAYKPFRYIQNFEVHPLGHGWHIHFVSDTFINLKKHFNKIQSFGFGRIQVKKITSLGITEYLEKHAFKPVRRSDKDGSTSRVRLINISRNLECPLRRFEVVGGSSGWLSPDKSDKHVTWKNQVIGKTYGVPVVPKWNFGNVNSLYELGELLT